MAGVGIYFRELIDGKRQTGMDKTILAFLALLSLPYELIIRLRAWGYAIGLLPSRKLDRPVISVGNLTVGGTGKTPTVAMLAKYFISRSKRVVVLSRGYGGSLGGRVGIVSDGASILLSPEEAGDEPYLLSATVPGLAVVVGADRFHSGMLAMQRLAPDVFILDDGFQHLGLQRDLNILLLDSSLPFSNGRTLPAGLLREPKSAASRADVIIYTRCSDGEEMDYFPSIPACRAFHHLVGINSCRGGALLPFSDLHGMRGVAFAGIADPAPFFRDLENEGLTLTKTISFPDHCQYGEKEIATILRLSAQYGADYIITTQKDSVKLGRFTEQLDSTYTAALELWVADPGPLVAALEKFL